MALSGSIARDFNDLIRQRCARGLIERVCVLLNRDLYLGPEAMAVKELVRAINLIFQFIIALEEQLLRQLVTIVCLLQCAEQRQGIESEPNLGGVAINFVDRPQKRRQRGRPALFVVLIQECFKGGFGVHSVEFPG